MLYINKLEIAKLIMNRKFWGVLLDEIEDNLLFRLKDIFKDSTDVIPTKRNILSVILIVYDPWDIYNRLLSS